MVPHSDNVSVGLIFCFGHFVTPLVINKIPNPQTREDGALSSH